MNTRPRPAPPGGVFHVAHTLTANDATTLTLKGAEQRAQTVWMAVIANGTTGQPTRT